jgi:hypothetical protein
VWRGEMTCSRYISTMSTFLLHFHSMVKGNRGKKNWLDRHTHIHALLRVDAEWGVRKQEVAGSQPKVHPANSSMVSNVRGTSTSTLPRAPDRPGQAGLPTSTPNTAAAIYQSSTLEYLSLHTHRSDFDANQPTMKPLPMMNNRAIHLGLITVNLSSSCTSRGNFPDRPYSN